MLIQGVAYTRGGVGRQCRQPWVEQEMDARLFIANVERSRRAVFPHVLDTVFHKTHRMRTPHTKMTTSRMPFAIWTFGVFDDTRVVAFSPRWLFSFTP